MSDKPRDDWHLEMALTASTEPIEPYDIWHAANCFYESSLLLLNESVQPKKASHLLPAEVLAFFSLELLLKCLHSIRGTLAPKMGHGLVALFESLRDTDQLHIRLKHESFLERNNNPKFEKVVTASKAPMDAKSVLTRCNKLFEQMRYPYETISLATTEKTDGSGPVAGAIGLSELICAVQALILECRRDWDQKLIDDADKPYIRTPGAQRPKL